MSPSNHSYKIAKHPDDRPDSQDQQGTKKKRKNNSICCDPSSGKVNPGPCISCMFIPVAEDYLCKQNMRSSLSKLKRRKQRGSNCIPLEPWQIPSDRVSKVKQYTSAHTSQLTYTIVQTAPTFTYLQNLHIKKPSRYSQLLYIYTQNKLSANPGQRKPDQPGHQKQGYNRPDPLDSKGKKGT